MLQNITSRFSHLVLSKQTEATSSLSSAQRSTAERHNIDHRGATPKDSMEREKGAVYHAADQHSEHQPLLDSCPDTSSLKYGMPKATDSRQSALALYSHPPSFKSADVLQEMRRIAEINRDQWFAGRVEELLKEVHTIKPVGFSEFTIETSDYRPSKIVGDSNRLCKLKKIYFLIEPNRCKFSQLHAETFTAALLAELILFYQTAPPSDRAFIDHLDTITTRISTYIHAIESDKETMSTIRKTLKTVVMDWLWQCAVTARNDGRTHHLDLLLARHKKWQNG